MTTGKDGEDEKRGVTQWLKNNKREKRNVSMNKFTLFTI
jgi:hypothetical protein